ncbi:formyl transferase [Streptomyces sp. YIM 98790]|uniref:formyl transferase n=1 Tax=Streptomyces sp. YIM 98790 TaxID=2689077 RepID=UPI001407BC40|nr:formyl transferase [Streptomyces sp. YIM 98790]
MPGLRVAVIHSDDHHHRYLESLLRSRFTVPLVVVEPESEKIRALRRRRKYRDWAYSVYHRRRRRLTGKNRYRRNYFAGHPLPPPDGRTLRLHVPSANAPEAEAALRLARPDVTVIIGCSVLKARIIRAAGPRMVNVHGGLLPYYRGNHCFFFALHHGRPDRVGSTIHHVTTGVDAGPVIETVRPPMTGTETAEQLYCRAERLAIHRLLAHLQRLEEGTELPATPQPASVGRTYRTRDRGPSHDMIHWLRRTRTRLRPRRPRTP